MMIIIFKSLKEEVKFVIEGGGKAIKTSFVRKNEEEFFEFITDFNNPSQNKNQHKAFPNKNSSFISSVWRKRKTIKSPILITPQDFGIP